jgi:MFS family permease
LHLGKRNIVNRTADRTLLLTAAVIISVAVVGFATGLTIPLVSLRLYQRGHEEWLIGLMAAAPALGFVASAPLLRTLVARLGMKRLLLVCFAVSALSILLLEVFTSAIAWFPLRLAMGAAAGIIIAIGESWINELVDDARRGRLIALYATIYTVCQFFGPTLLSLMGTHGATPILLATLLHGVAAALFLRVGANGAEAAVEADTANLSMASFVRQAPAICAGIVFFSFFDSTVLSLFPVYAVQHGYSTAVAAFMASVVLGGDAFLQMPIGWLADHMNRARLHRLCGVLALALGAVLPLAMPHPWLVYPLLAVLGAVAGGIYTLALIQIGQRYSGHDLVTANAASGVLWGAGSMVGPLLGGVAASAGSNGLPLILTLAAFGFVAVTFSQTQQTVQAEPEETQIGDVVRKAQ